MLAPKPKLIDRWRDPHDNITNYVYQYPNGVRYVIAQNPATIDFDIAVVIRGGNYFETQLKVPQGTAHFLEHIFAGNPNAKFRTREAMDAFRFGNKRRPGIGYNASTGKRHLNFYMHGNESGAARMVEYLHHMVHYPANKVAQFIEKERKVILAEYQRLRREDKDPGLAADQFILGERYPEFVGRVIGTAKSINEVSEDHIHRYHQGVFGAENLVIAVQAKEKPTGELARMIDNMAAKFTPLPQPLLLRPDTLENKFKYSAFQDPQRQGLFTSIFTVKPYQPTYNYRLLTLNYLFRRMISKVGFDYLREKLGLVYSVDSFRAPLTWDWDAIGYRFTCEVPNFPQLLNENTHLFQKGLDFVRTKQGDNWFKGEISGYIFDRTSQFDPAYAEDIATDVLAGKYKFDFEQAKSTARKVTISDLVAHVEENYLNLPPHIWIDSPAEREEVLQIVADSEFAKHYTALNA